MCPYVFFYPSRFPVGYRKVFAYLNANVVKVLGNASDDGVKKHIFLWRKNVPYNYRLFSY